MADFPDIKTAIAAQHDDDTRELMELIAEHLLPPSLAFLLERHRGSRDFKAFNDDLVAVISSLAATILANAIPAANRNTVTNNFCDDIVSAMQRGKLL